MTLSIHCQLTGAEESTVDFVLWILNKHFFDYCRIDRYLLKQATGLFLLCNCINSKSA